MNRILKLLCPTQCVRSVDLIDLHDLRRRGIRAVLLDLDNTLVPWHRYDISPAVARWTADLREQGIKACIVSNTSYPKRLKRLSGEFGMPYATNAMKPRRGGFRQGIQLLDVENAETAVIGDQIFTDILGGNRLGLHTILVVPIEKKEFAGTKVTRFFERIVLGVLERRGMIQYPRHAIEISGEQTIDAGRQK